MLAPMTAAEGADGDGRIGRAEDSRSRFLNRLARQRRHDRDGGHIRRLALIGRHAERCVTLHMLDRPEAFLMGELQVLHRYVVLLVEPGAFRPFDHPEGGNGGIAVLRRGQVGRRRPDPETRQSRDSLRRAAPKAGGGGIVALRRARHCQARRRVGAGDEGGDVVAPDGFATLMAGQVNGGRPAAGNGDQVGEDAVLRPRRMADRGVVDAVATNRIRHRAAGNGAEIGPLRRVAARIDHRRHVQPRRAEIRRRAPAVIVVGEDGDGFARRHGVAIEVSPRRARQHDAGPVVVLKGDGPLDRARTEDRAAGDQFPHALARQVARQLRHVLAHPLQRAIDAAIVDAENRGAGHERHIRHGGEFGHCRSRPDRRQLSADLMALGVQPPAHDEILIGEDHPRPRAPRRQRRHQARRPGADDQQVAMAGSVLVL